NEVTVFERVSLGRHITTCWHDPEVELFLQTNVAVLADVAAIATIAQSSDCAFGKPVRIQKGKNELIPIQTGTHFLQCLHDACLTDRHVFIPCSSSVLPMSYTPEIFAQILKLCDYTGRLLTGFKAMGYSSVISAAMRSAIR